MKIKTANTILYCRKWSETVAFYKTRLGFPVSVERDWFVEFVLNETTRLSVADTARTTIKSSGGNGITVTLEVDDIDNTHSRLVEAGLKPPPVRDHPWGARIIHVHDPEGHRLEFWSPS